MEEIEKLALKITTLQQSCKVEKEALDRIEKLMNGLINEFREKREEVRVIENEIWVSQDILIKLNCS